MSAIDKCVIVREPRIMNGHNNKRQQLVGSYCQTNVSKRIREKNSKIFGKTKEGVKEPLHRGSFAISCTTLAARVSIGFKQALIQRQNNLCLMLHKYCKITYILGEKISLIYLQCD